MKKLLLFMILLLPIISAASSFTIELKPHYYLDSQEVLVYNNETSYNGLLFEVIGKNLNLDSRVIDLQITSLSPELAGAFQNTTKTLISGQEKTLWVSQIIDTTKLKNKSILFFVGVTGRNEVLKQIFYTEGQKEIIINNPEDNTYDIVKNIGNWIYEGNYQLGLLFGMGVIFIMGLILWRYKAEEKMEKWRNKK